MFSISKTEMFQNRPLILWPFNFFILRKQDVIEGIEGIHIVKPILFFLHSFFFCIEFF